MARDAEPVGPRTTRLLRSTANRRVSILPSDAPAGAEEAATPWNINTEEQLFHWASNQPDEVLNMLNELRSQRDLALQLNEHWLLVQDDHKKRAEQLEAAFDKNDELEEKNNQLQSELLNVKAEQRQADRPRPRQVTQPAEQRPQEEASPTPEVEQRPRTSRESSTLSGNGNHKSTKFPDPPIFTGTGEPTWESWTTKISDKLDANADHYPTEKLRIAYVASRLGGDADEQTYAKRRIGAPSPYLSLTELLEHLDGIYGDQDRNRKCRREYNALKQVNKPFSTFYSEFTKLSSFLGYDDRTLMDDLQDKINNRLQDALSVCPIEFTSLDRLKIFLQRVDNKQRANYQLRGEQRTVKPVAAPEKRFVPSSTPAPAPATSYVRPATFSTPEPERPRMPITCFNCKVPGHLSKDCPQLKASTSAPRAFTPRLNEITTEDMEEEEMFTEESEDEAKN